MRRLLTIPVVLLATVLLTVTAPIWLPLGALLSLAPKLHGMLRFLCFITVYVWCESIGIVVSLAIWLRYGIPARNSQRWPDFLDANFRLQCWWAHSLKLAAAALFNLRFDVQGEGALHGPPVLFLPRHASIGDTVIPIVWYCMPEQMRLRYVLKRELLLDPCLDIVGNRLPNYFVDRMSDDPAQEVGNVAKLLSGIGPNEGVLIYPEGTRFSATKREQVLTRLRDGGDDQALQRAESWPHLLPPRLGGTLALLAANPGLDVLFCAHVGFEASASFSQLINGGWTNSHVRMHFWRVPFAEVPADGLAQREFLFAQWQRMNDELHRLRQLAD